MINSLIAAVDSLFVRRPGLIVGLVACVAVALYTVSVTPVGLHGIRSDYASYTAVLLQHENPALFPRDTLFQRGVFTHSLWASNQVYMLLMQFFYHLTGERMDLAIFGLAAISFGIYIPAAYILLVGLFPNRWLALVLALASARLFGFLGLPTGLFAGVGCILTHFILHGWLLPGFKRQPVILWKVVLAGLLVSLSVPIVSSVNTLLFVLYVLPLALFQGLVKRLPFRTLLAFMVGLIPMAGFVFLGAGGVTPLSRAGARYIMLRHVATGDLLFSSIAASLFFVGIAVCYLLRRQRFPWLVTGLLLLLQMVYWLTFLELRFIAFWLGLYLLYRFVTNAITPLEYAATAALTIACLGVYQRALWFVVWQITGWSFLASPVFQMFRLPRLAAFALLFLSASAVVALTEFIPDRGWRAVVTASLAFLFYFAAQPLDFLIVPAGQEGLSRTLLVMLTLVLMTRTFWRRAFTVPGLRSWPVLSAGAAGLIAGAGIILWLASQGLTPVSLVLVTVSTAGTGAAVVLAWLCTRTAAGRGLALLLTAGVVLQGSWLMGYQEVSTRNEAHLLLSQALARSAEEREALPGQLKIPPEFYDYYDLMQWIKASTPVDSLFHVTDMQRHGFRFLAERSLLLIDTDSLFTINGYSDPEATWQLYLEAKDANLYHDVTRFAARYQVDYVLTDVNTRLEPVPMDEKWVVPEIIYAGEYFVLYHLTRMETLPPSSGDD